MKKEKNKNIVKKTTETLRNVSDGIVDGVAVVTDSAIDKAEEGFEIVKDEIDSAKDYTKNNKKKVRDGILIIIFMLICLSGGIFGTKMVDKKISSKEDIKPIELKDLVDKSENYIINEVSQTEDYEVASEQKYTNAKYYEVRLNNEVKYIIEEKNNNLNLKTTTNELINKINENELLDSINIVNTKEGTYLLFIEKDKCTYNTIVYNIKNNQKGTLNIINTNC